MLREPVEDGVNQRGSMRGGALDESSRGVERAAHVGGREAEGDKNGSKNDHGMIRCQVMGPA